MAQQLASLASLLQNIQIPPDVNPLIVSMPKPPKLEGALAPNDWLTKVQILANNRVLGPESMVVYRGHIFTGQADGWLVHITPDGSVQKIIRLSMPPCGMPDADEGACGRPLGMRVDNLGYLVVADAYSGIVRINPKTGHHQWLVNSKTLLVNNRSLGYINDLVLSRDGKIFFTSSSSKWPLSREDNIVLEAENSGRVLVYDPNRAPGQQVQELITQLSFPNGLELSKDESYLLVGEGTRSRILRAWIGPKSDKRGIINVFASNLPGIVNNIRRSPRNTYWVGFMESRHSNLPNVLDLYGDKPRTRAVLISLVNRRVRFDNPRFGIVVELDTEGQIVRSLQDPLAETYSSVSEIAEEDGVLYFASPDKNFIGYLRLDSLGPQPRNLTGQNVSAPLSTNPKVAEFLDKVRTKLGRASGEYVKGALLELLKEYISARHQIAYLQRQNYNRLMQVYKLQRYLQQLLAAGNVTSTVKPASNATTTVTVIPLPTTPSPSNTTVSVTTSATSNAPNTTSTAAMGGGVINTTTTMNPTTTTTEVTSTEVTSGIYTTSVSSIIIKNTTAASVTAPRQPATAAATTATLITGVDTSVNSTRPEPSIPKQSTTNIGSTPAFD